MKVSNVKSQLSRAFALLNCLAIGFVATGCDSDNPVDGTKVNTMPTPSVWLFIAAAQKS